MPITMTEKHREYLVSKAVLVEPYSMMSMYEEHKKEKGEEAQKDIEAFAGMEGYYPITVNGLPYYTDDKDMYEESLETEE